MDHDVLQNLIVLFAVCGSFVLLFSVAAALRPRYQDIAKRNGWTIQPHPKDQRDFLFKGQSDGIGWEMEYYMYEHYRKYQARHIPFTNVIVWTSKDVRLDQSTLFIHPRRDKLEHFVHPRLALEDATDPATNHERQGTEKILSALPERSFGNSQFQDLFIMRTNLEVLPEPLIHLLQTELLAWQKIQFVGPVILVNRNGLTLWWIPLGMKTEWLEKTVRLGTTLAHHL